MPHAHAAAVVDRLLRRLASDARRLELPPHIDDDLEHVGRTLSRLQDVLVSLEARSGAQEWMGEIKQVAYDVEDLLDEFEVEDHSSIKSQTSGCISEAAPLCRACSFLLLSPSTNRMKTIRRRLDFSEKDSIIFSSMQYSCPDVEKFDNGVFDTSAIVGRDNDKAKIKDMLLQSNEEKLSVIPIVGLVGLGKTTLARLIFLDQEEGLNFDCRIWIFLNRKLDLIKVASDIISQCNHKEGNLLDVHTDIEIQGNLQLLKNSLQEALREKRCLIVLDDLSSTDKSQLDELKEMLKGTNECVKVLVTTSSEITAELVHTIPPYKLRPLSEDDSWTIFSQKAFGNSNSNNAHLLEVGKEIMKRCEGVPLLTHFLSSIVHNQDTDMWLAAKDEEIWKLERRLATKVELFSPLYRIYYEFPSITKLCFLYLSIFPKGSAIDKEKLIRQWIALEIIGSKHDSFPPYVHGEMCIQDLLSTHFLQVQNMHSDGAPKYTVIDSSRTVKASPRFGTTSEQSVGPISSSKVSMASKEILSTLHRLDKSEMSAQMRGDVFLNLSLRQVRKATRNFSPLLKLGEGGIWAVYRAVLPDNLIVTIRRAKKGHIQEAKCLMKVKLLTEISHWSLVRFLGFIDKGNECIRITEYVPNGTLRQHLHDQHKRILDFNQRIVIALDVAIALTYLHLCFGQAVICYNLKTSNILLTESYRAKVCCSELSGIGHVMALTGTVGYIDPEYFQTSELTAKSDVYSFGILLLEILSSHGPQDWNVLMNHQQSSVVQWALEKFYDDLMNEILDYRMEDRVAGEVLRDWLSLALSCVASRGNDRPSIEVVGERLWKIWKDHRRNIGEQHEYEGSWDEFVKQEGILRHEKSVLKKNWAPSATEEEWFGYIKQIELVQEGCSVTQDKEHLLRSRSASLGDSNTTVSPR
ncbi:disease resistance protein RGA2 isoform X3 [Setaria italica]|uniref:disease resistance protein RGA2 isoform X3 n=1 Tax=Setaria italica TaxID=4555 RepID=UPI000BE56ADA|nr:disease resistance protein RGA2 isoform X3 [Setaria italica]